MKKTILIMVLVLIATALLFSIITSEDDFDCDKWNGKQCIDSESEWYGCNVESKQCFNFCQKTNEEVENNDR